LVVFFPFPLSGLFDLHGPSMCCSSTVSQQ
jgi:hypothetical protein